MSETRRFILYAENRLGPLSSKTANGLIRYRPREVLAVIDSTKAGQTVASVLGYGGDIPILASVEAGLEMQPDVMVIGIAPIGGGFSEEWRPAVRTALAAGLQVWSGLHYFLSGDPEFSKYGDQIWDLRKAPAGLTVARGHWKARKSKVLLTIGSDSHIGKMTTALELQTQLAARGVDSLFIGTGQTGVAIAERGVSVDAVVADFINGSIEAEIDKVDGEAPLILVEGQGAVTHQGYSGVTMGLIHGCMPDYFVIAHQPSRQVDDYGHPLPSLAFIANLHETLLSPFKHARVLGVNLYSKDMLPDEIAPVIAQIRRMIHLPVEDMVREPTGEVANAVALTLKRDFRGR
ncbi:MAG: DUF1611 domain-containing protein [Candidatus Marinimicrobia bacterium]|nr:DUF1611 domain-containing protein [Candidatus Neomarinimicrobiota bacterium]MCF7902755.1 DUF1611 domain-containing protein [Candidatus Neomarinimicrobiota bacterium]